jgi:hypothetical protein
MASLMYSGTPERRHFLSTRPFSATNPFLISWADVLAEQPTQPRRMRESAEMLQYAMLRAESVLPTAPQHY